MVRAIVRKLVPTIRPAFFPFLCVDAYMYPAYPARPFPLIHFSRSTL